MTNSLVIGANGFIASYLVDALVGLGHEVTAFDRFRGETVNFTADGVERFRGDFLNRADLEAAVEGKDLVFHFLSTTTPATAASDPTLDLRTNVAQSVELLQACTRAQVSHVFFASTGGAIYGSQGRTNYVEFDRALPVSPYAIGKLTIEQYLDYFRTAEGLQSTSLRISNPYGGRQKPDRVQGLIPIALRRIALGQPVVRLGDGSMVRDYIYVTDVVELIVRMVQAGSTQPIYNLGSGRGHTIDEVLDVVRAVTGRDFAVEELPKPPTYVDRVVLDIGRWLDEFGQFAFTPLERGVELTYREVVKGIGLRSRVSAAEH